MTQEHETRTIKWSAQARWHRPSIHDLPYKRLAQITFWGTAVLVSFWVYVKTGDIITTIWASVAAGGAAAAISVNLFLNHALIHIYQRDEVEEEIVSLPPSIVPDAEIPCGGGRVMKMPQPRRGDFANWARLVVEGRSLFSKNECERRNFGYDITLRLLKEYRLVHDKPDNRGVHMLTEAGRGYLAAWLEMR